MSRTSPVRRHQNLLRYGLWLLVAQTAFANRQHYRLVTTWLPHLLTNSLSLLLPDALRLIFSSRHRSRNLIEATLLTMVRDNPRYAVYVAPLALGYIVSHPRFNIYKGKMGDLRVAGVGLDAIPHTATAFAFSALAADTVDTMGSHANYAGLLAALLRRSQQSPELISLTLLALITLNWEYGEYQMQQYELARVSDPTAINMQWTPADTARDVISNFLGWLLAMLWRRSKQREK
ncbi:MAG: hypothetical protein J0M07_14120 [Anaerolineae bacterium]|nr:hypothetical protein [Anaerolineae bacterium]